MNQSRICSLSYRIDNYDYLQRYRIYCCPTQTLPPVEGIYVHRVPECLSLPWNLVPHSLPLKQVHMCLPHWTQRREEQHFLAGEGEPIGTTGKKAWHSVYYVLLPQYTPTLLYFNQLLQEYVYTNIFGNFLRRLPA